MRISVQSFTVHKQFPLTISRGTTAQTTNVWVQVEQDGIEGWGEASPFSIGSHRQTSSELLDALQKVAPALAAFSPWDRQQIEQLLLEMQVPSAARAGVDVALHDWLGKRVRSPLWQIWGLNRNSIAPTSVTIGISSPADARKRVRDWLSHFQTLPGNSKVQFFKVKLGSPDGIEADRAMLMAVREEAPAPTLSVDANGGWSLDDAVTMCNWLAQLGVKYVEQPLPPEVGANHDSPLQELYKKSPLPIFVDESCFTSQDIPQLANRVHGINIKLMKCGGLSEAIRMVHAARACGLQVMFGCYSDSTLSNTAAAQLSPLGDYLDLDSHLNLIDDPFTGATVQEGSLVPNELPGLGVRKSNE